MQAATEIETVCRKFRTCTICEAGCGLVFDVDSRGSIASVRGDKEDPLSAGYLCPKSQAMSGVAKDPDLLRAPLLRVGDEWVEIGWEEAIERAALGLAAVRDRHGPQAVATYAGNPVSNNMGALLYSGALINAIGSNQNYTAASIDVYPKLLTNLLMYGDTELNPIPDLDNTDLIVIFGANPVVSNGSVWTSPGLPNRLKALRARGGRLVVVDPRRTETAAIADDHLAIRSSTDALLLLALVNVFFEDGLIALGALAEHVKNLGELKAIATAFSPERVAPLTDIDAVTIRALARAIAAAPAAAIYGRVGTCCQLFGSLCCWLIETLNILSGNLDRAGGTVFGRPVIPTIFGSSYNGTKLPFGRFHTRVRKLSELGGRLPAAALAEEINDDGDGRVRALVTIAGNPARSLPNSEGLVKALGKLDFMVSLDFYLNETTRHANLILPPLDAIYRSHCTLFFGGYISRSYARFSPPVLPVKDGGLQDWEILARIGAKLKGQEDEPYERDYLLGLIRWTLARMHRTDVSPQQAFDCLEGANGPEKLCDLFLRLGEFGDGLRGDGSGLTLADLASYPHGVDLGPVGSGRIGGLIRTPDRRVDLAPPLITDDIPRLEKWVAAGNFDVSDSFLLNGRRDLRSMNSWLHNLPNLAKGPDRNRLLINPADAQTYQIADGETVIIERGDNILHAQASLTADIRPGELSLPHGWGHDAVDTRLNVARLRPGTNFNMLTEDLVDVPSGNAVFNGVRVRLRRLNLQS